jgi:predicted outer membrane repeat protein
MTITLGSTLVVTRTMTIQGAGAAASIISGNLQTRVIVHEPASYYALTIRDVTIRDGTTAGSPGGGIEVQQKGQLILERCRLVHNYAASGGGVFCTIDTNVFVTDVEFTDNHATLDSGGALYAYGGCRVTMTSNSIHHNDALESGGGVSAQDNGAVSITESTIVSNTADQGGGGIYLASGADVQLYSSTVAANHAKNAGGGGVKAESGTTVSIQNSILANNYIGAFITSDNDFNGSVTANQQNIMRHHTNGTIGGTGTVSTEDPLLGPLQDNGGRTPTTALKDGSPAIDAVAGCNGYGNVGLTTDQRGVKRVLGSGCDLGPYERAPCGDVDGDGSVNLADVFFLINALFASGPPPPGLANVNGDSAVDVGDVFFLVNRLFAGGSAPDCAGT